MSRAALASRRRLSPQASCVPQLVDQFLQVVLARTDEDAPVNGARWSAAGASSLGSMAMMEAMVELALFQEGQ